MAAPVVPQRPARSQDPPALSAQALDAPMVPPRPSRTQRSQSPSADREANARSPLNLPYTAPPPKDEKFVKRPSVASLPLVGQEGMEYASLDQAASTLRPEVAAPNELRTVAHDLPLHAPRASTASAREQVAHVVRTDSTKAAASGIGKPLTEVDATETSPRPPSAAKHGSGIGRPHSGASHELAISRTASRPESMMEKEHEQGIPEIGLQIPLNPMAGDVQAPSPAPFTAHSTGSGYLDSRPATGHSPGRRRSSVQWQGPPGAYGLHGHGLAPKDRFEQAWYSKHPDERTKEEEGAYGPSMASSRGQWALSSEELNKIVRDTKSPGIGTDPHVFGIPSEQVGYLASEEYAARLSQPSSRRASSTHNASALQTHVDLPLRKTRLQQGIHDDGALESDDEAVHVDEPAHQGRPDYDLHRDSHNSDEWIGYAPERNVSTPALASDETAKDPGSAYLHPAISPSDEKADDESYFPATDSGAGSPMHGSFYKTKSRESSRPSSMHGPSGLSRFVTTEDDPHTPLEEIDEYEPLFGGDTEDENKLPVDAASRFKKIQKERLTRFPSKDIWEDTPESLYYTSTVNSAQEPLSSSLEKSAPISNFETPDQEQNRREVAAGSSFLDDEEKRFKKMGFKQRVQDDIRRPGISRRFPSQDIWEDTPDSLRLVSTIDPEQERKPVPTVPARPARSKQTAQISPSDSTSPSQSKEVSPIEKRAPPMPGKPKPQVSVKPKASQEAEEGAPLRKTTSASSTGSASEAAASKSKTSVPPRPGQGSKIAALKAGFLNDLNSRLQLGPQAVQKAAPKEESREVPVEDEPAPLTDARRGRARGPQRRKPAEASAATATTSAPVLSMIATQHVWSVPTSGSEHLTVGLKPQSKLVEPTLESPDMMPIAAAPLARNIAGESLAAKNEEPEETAEKLAPLTQSSVSHEAMDARAAAEDKARMQKLAEHDVDTLVAAGDVPEHIASKPGAADEDLGAPVGAAADVEDVKEGTEGGKY